jgi:hypothetical protein
VPNELRILWLSTAVTSQIVRTPTAHKVRVKFYEGWKKRVQEYEAKVRPRISDPDVIREAQEVGLAIVEADKDLHTLRDDEGFNAKVNGNEIGQITLSSVEGRYAEIITHSAAKE